MLIVVLIIMKHVILFLLIIISSNSNAQDIKVESFFCDENDLTANRQSTEVFDQNGDKCALLRIQTTHKGYVFDVGSAGIQSVDDNRVGEIWLWVPYGIKHISIRHQLYGNIINYNFPIAIQKAKVYIMQLSNNNKIRFDEEKTKRVTFAIQPTGAKLRLNGINVPLKDGKTEMDIPIGQHKLKIDCENYESLDSVLAVDEISSTYHISLKPIFGKIIIESIPTSSVVYLDGVERGVTPIQLNYVIIGNHLVELKNKDDFSDYRDSIEISKNIVSNVNITLEKKINVCFELDGFEKNMKAYFDGVTMKVVDDKLLVKTDKGNHNLSIKYDNLECHSNTYTLLEDSEIFRVNLKSLKITAKDVNIYKYADLSSYTYVGTIKEKYNGGSAFGSLNESNYNRCLRRIKKEAAKRGCRHANIISIIPGKGMYMAFQYLIVNLYK